MGVADEGGILCRFGQVRKEQRVAGSDLFLFSVKTEFSHPIGDLFVALNPWFLGFSLCLGPSGDATTLP